MGALVPYLPLVGLGVFVAFIVVTWVIAIVKGVRDGLAEKRTAALWAAERRAQMQEWEDANE